MRIIIDLLFVTTEAAHNTTQTHKTVDLHVKFEDFSRPHPPRRLRASLGAFGPSIVAGGGGLSPPKY